MKPDILARVRAAYLDQHGPLGYRELGRDILAIMTHGYLIHTPSACLMGFRCYESNIRHAISNGYLITPRVHSSPQGDTWFVWFALGSLQEILSIIPFPLINVAFSRRGVVRVWPLAKLIDHAPCSQTVSA